MDNQPFSIVEDDGFIAYSAALNPQYSMPSRPEVSEMLVPEYDLPAPYTQSASSLNLGTFTRRRDRVSYPKTLRKCCSSTIITQS